MSSLSDLTGGSAPGGDVGWESDSGYESWLFGAAPEIADEQIIDLALKGLQVGDDAALKEEIALRLTPRRD